MAPGKTPTQQQPTQWWKIETIEQKSHRTDVHHNIPIRREAIPIIIVPGLLASRLYREDDGKPVLGWDPDREYKLAAHYALAGPETRIRNLVGPHFDKNYLKVAGERFKTADLSDPFVKATYDTLVGQNLGDWDWPRPLITETDVKIKRDKQARLAIFNCWAGMPLGYYGDLMIKLANYNANNIGVGGYPPPKVDPRKFSTTRFTVSVTTGLRPMRTPARSWQPTSIRSSRTKPSLRPKRWPVSTSLW